MNDELPDFRRIVETLAKHNVRYVLVGGLALGAHGSSYLSFDMDIGYATSHDNARALVDALAELNPRLRGFPEGLPFTWDLGTLRSAANLTLDTEAGPLDLIGDIPGAPDFEHLWSRSVEREAFGHKIRVACVDDLIQMKEVANREKDQLHLRELREMKRALGGK